MWSKLTTPATERKGGWKQMMSHRNETTASKS